MSLFNRELTFRFFSGLRRDSGNRRLLACFVHGLMMLGIFWSLARDASGSVFEGMPITTVGAAKTNGEFFLEGLGEFVAHLDMQPLEFSICSLMQGDCRSWLYWLETRNWGGRIILDWIIPLRI